jgi:hypothetical protein
MPHPVPTHTGRGPHGSATGSGKEAVTALPIEQLCRQQQFTSDHPAWRIQARNWGQLYIAERQDRHSWHIVAALTLGGLLDRLDQIEAAR